MDTIRLRVGVSSCLLGEAVRYDGKHKRDAYIHRTLARRLELVPVCPEVGIGLGVPRPPIRLVGAIGAVRAVGRDDPSLDATARLTAYGVRMAHSFDDLSGYIFKSRSPSCGLESVPVLHRGQVRSGRGIYADAFLAHHPWLPAQEEDGLHDPALRDNFLERVCAYYRWRRFVVSGVTAAGLSEFHAAHKYALMAHRPRAVGELGRIVATAGRRRAPRLAEEYLSGFMTALSHPATPARHENVLLHLVGYLRGKLDRYEQHGLLDSIAAFRAGRVARRRVLILLRRAFQRYPDEYVARQVYLYPERYERRLRGL